MLPDEMAGMIMGIFIAPAVSHLAHETGYRVTQVEGHRLISALSYILLDPGVSLVQRIAFGGSRQINHGLS